MKRIKKPILGRRSAYLASVEPDLSLRQDCATQNINGQNFKTGIFYNCLLSFMVGENISCTHYRANVTILEYFQV